MRMCRGDSPCRPHRRTTPKYDAPQGVACDRGDENPAAPVEQRRRPLSTTRDYQPHSPPATPQESLGHIADKMRGLQDGNKSRGEGVRDLLETVPAVRVFAQEDPLGGSIEPSRTSRMLTYAAGRCMLCSHRVRPLPLAT